MVLWGGRQPRMDLSEGASDKVQSWVQFLNQIDLFPHNFQFSTQGYVFPRFCLFSGYRKLVLVCFVKTDGLKGLVIIWTANLSFLK